MADADNVEVYRTEAIATEGRRNYGQWQFNCVTASGCRFVDARFEGPVMQSAMEAFGASEGKYIRPSVVNGMFSYNTTDNIEYRDLYGFYRQDAIVPEYADINDNPLINFNANSGGGTAAVYGDSLHGAVLAFEGPFTETGTLMRGVVVAPSVQEVGITDVLYWIEPAYQATAYERGNGLGMNGSATSNNLLTNFRTMARAVAGGGYSDTEIQLQTGGGLTVTASGLVGELVSDTTAAGVTLLDTPRTPAEYLADQGANTLPTAGFVVYPVKGDYSFDFFPYEPDEWDVWDSPYTTLSTDSDGEIVRYWWEVRDAGDSVVFESQSRWTSTLLPGPGTYTVKLTVMDDRSGYATASCSLDATTGVCS